MQTNLADKKIEKHIARAMQRLRALGIECCDAHTKMIESILQDLAQKSFDDGCLYRVAELKS